MTQKTYIIRKSAYGYTDEHYFEMSLGSITDTFTDEAAAYQRLTELEIPLFRSYDMSELEQTSPYTSNEKYQDMREELDAYLKAEFGKSFLMRHEPKGYLMAERNSYLGQDYTDEHIMKIREITGIRFHEMSVFENDVTFYAIWLPYSNKFYQIDRQDMIYTIQHLKDDVELYNAKLQEFRDAVFFYNSYDEALADATYPDAYRLYTNIPLQGTLEELSEQPIMLKSFIETTIGVDYDNDKQAIAINYGINPQDYAGLNALLKQPLFEIREFPYEDAKDIPHAPFEYM